MDQTFNKLCIQNSQYYFTRWIFYTVASVAYMIGYICHDVKRRSFNPKVLYSNPAYMFLGETLHLYLCQSAQLNNDYIWEQFREECLSKRTMSLHEKITLKNEQSISIQIDDSWCRFKRYKSIEALTSILYRSIRTKTLITSKMLHQI